MIFRRRKPEHSEGDGGETTRALRLQALHVEAAEIGIERADDSGVFGLVMDTTYARGVATLVAFADGTTSLYTSTGFAIIGGGAHEQVVRATQALLRLVEHGHPAFEPDASDEPPAEGSVTIRLLTHEGRLAATEDEVAHAEGRSDLSEIFHRAHTVIAELRELDAAGRD